MRRLDQDLDDGSLEAYEVSISEEQVSNWITSQVADTKIANNLLVIVRDLCKSVAIAKSIFVEEKSRGQGIGGDLIQLLLNDSTSDVLFLVADQHESQDEGFILYKWYESVGFKRILHTSAGPLMAYPEAMADRILEKLSLLSEDKNDNMTVP
jgi:GNAT superfamily N-acetyltransferase